MPSLPSLDPLEVSHPTILTFPNFSMSSFAIEANRAIAAAVSSRGQCDAPPSLARCSKLGRLLE